MSAFCMNCGAALPEGAGFCPKCGTKIETPHCPACGKELNFGVEFCIYCGQRVKEETPAPEPEQESVAGIPEAIPCPEAEEPASEQTATVAETPAPEANAVVPQCFVWAYAERQGMDRMIHAITVKMEGKSLYIGEELSSVLQKSWSRSLPTKEIPLEEIKDIEVPSGKLVITEWSGKATKIKGDDPELLRQAAVAILTRIGKDPDDLKDETPVEQAVSTGEASSERSVEPPPDPDNVQEFSWTDTKAQGRIGKAVTTTRLLLDGERLRIQKEFSDTLTKHTNLQPEEVIPLSAIESVSVKKKGPAMSVILLFLCIALVAYGCVIGSLDFTTALVCVLGLGVLILLRYGKQMHNFQMVITEKDQKHTVLKGNELQAMETAAAAILARVGLKVSDGKAKKASPLKMIGIIAGAAVVIILAIVLFEESYLKQSFPSSVMQDPSVQTYVSGSINYDLDYLLTSEITGGRLLKSTSMPQYKNNSLTYFFVDYLYYVTITAADGRSASGQVSVNCSFEAEPFQSKPNDILINSLTYTEEIHHFIAEQAEQNSALLDPADLIGCWKLIATVKDGETQLPAVAECVCLYEDNACYRFCESHKAYGTEYVITTDNIGYGEWHTQGMTGTIAWNNYDWQPEIEPWDLYFEDEYLILYAGENVWILGKISASPDYVYDAQWWED